MQAQRQGLAETRSRNRLGLLKGNTHGKAVSTRGSQAGEPEIPGHESVRAEQCPEHLQDDQGTRQG